MPRPIPPPGFNIQGPDSSRVLVTLLGHFNETLPSGPDGESLSEEDAFFALNSIEAEVRVETGGFIGQARNVCFLSSELLAFLDALREVKDVGEGDASLDPNEPYLQLQIVALEPGQIEVAGELTDDPESGRSLSFHWEMNEAQLTSLIAELERCAQVFPIR